MTHDPATDSRAATDRVAAHWSDSELTERLAQIHWMGSPVVRAHLNRLVSGDPQVDWLTWSWGRFVLPLSRRRQQGLTVLVLGCGDGWLERALAGRPEVATIVACDVAAGAVEAAREVARDQGLDEVIRYAVVDLDREPPPGGPWDVVIAHSVLHHVRELERCYDALAVGLRPDGLLLVNEYTGPRRFQFAAEQMAVINGVLRRWPERLRRSAATGGPYGHKDVPDEAELIATDPSEAVRSDEVMPRLAERFDLLADVGCGGSVLHLLLYDVVQNFDPADPGDRRLLRLLCFLEESLVAAGELASDYRVAVARPRVGRRAVEAPPGQRRPSVVPEPVQGGGESPSPERLRIHSRPTLDRRHGLESRAVRRALHERVTGNPETDWIGYALRLHTPAGGDGPAWVLGEEDSWLPARLDGQAGISSVVLVSPEALEKAPEGPPPAWVFCDGWLGRSPDRDSQVARLAAALRPGGLLVGDELIAPGDRRSSRAVLQVSRELLELLQPPGAGGRPAGERWRDRLVDFEHAVWRERFGPRRQELGELLGEQFRLEEHKPQLGALLQRVLAPLAEGPGGGLPDEDFLALLCYTEELLTDGGVIAAEHACFVARRV